MGYIFLTNIQTVSFLIFFFHFSLYTLAQQNVTCYWPDGTALIDQTNPNDYYQACPLSFGNDGFHMCCKTAGGFNEVCTDQGLCSRPQNPSLGEAQGVLRSTCTDPSWQSSSCVHLCTTGLDIAGDAVNGSEIYVVECTDGSWCCEGNTKLNATQQAEVTTCCDQGQGMFVVDGKVTNVNPSSTSSVSSTASPTAAATSSSASASATSLAPVPHHTDAGAIAGGVVGGIAGLAIIAGAIVFFMRRRSKGLEAAEFQDGQRNPQSRHIHEMETPGKSHEVDTPGKPYEKSGNERFEKDGRQLPRQDPGPYEI